MDGRDNVDQNGAQRHRVDGLAQKCEAEFFKSHDKKRHIEHDDHRTDRQNGCKKVNDLRNTRKAADRKAIRCIEPIERQGIQHAGKRDNDIAFHLLAQFFIFHKFSPLTCFSQASDVKSARAACRRCPPS